MDIEAAAVVFDLDDTLVDHRSASREAVLQWGRSIGARGSDNDLVGRWVELEAGHYARYQGRHITKTEQRRTRVRGFLDRPELSGTDADTAFAAYWVSYAASWRPFPDAVPAIRRACGAGLAVAVLTNGAQDDQELKFVATGLARTGTPSVCIVVPRRSQARCGKLPAGVRHYRR